MSKGRILTILILIAAILVGSFAYLTLRPSSNVEQDVELSEVDKLLTMKVESNYPSTPREVVKLYNRYLMVLYNEELQETDFKTMLEKQRVFYDDELLGINSFESNYSSLVVDVANYRKDEKTIVKTNVSGSAEVTYKEVDGKKYAILEASYFVKSGSSKFSKTFERYLLRKDSTGKWRILGFNKVASETA